MNRIKWKHYINYLAVGGFTLLLAILTLTDVIQPLAQATVLNIGICIILAVSLSLVVGFLGELSLGHAGFMCIGAYLGGKVAACMPDAIGKSFWGLLASLAIGGIAAAVFGVLIGLPALRLKGDYLAIVTLAFGEIIRVIFMNSSPASFGGALGLKTPRYNIDGLCIVTFLLILLTLAIVQNIIRSKHGRAITAVRDNEIAARACGINVTKYKLMVFSVAAFFAGIAGVLYSFSQSRVQYDHFGYDYSIEILVMVVLGGMGNVNGAIIAATLITYLNVQLATTLTGDLAVIKNILYALIMVVIVIYRNAPVLKAFREKYNVRAVVEKLRARKPDPSIVRDDIAEWANIPTKIDMDELLSTDVKLSSTKPDRPDPQNGGQRDE